MDESDHDEADVDESGPELFSPRTGGSYRQPGLSEPRPGWWQGQDGLWYPPYPYCDCHEIAETERELELHLGPQDTEGEAWALLLQLVDDAAADGREVFSPGAEIPRQFWAEIVTLPASIAELKAVRELELYGSHLIAVPPEIGQMSSLRSFDPYTSRRLHWLPFEITRCSELIDSRISTRHLYGNHKTRLPFPRLPAKLPPGSTPRTCSVCNGPFDTGGPIQRWISRWVGTDVVPLLVHACSDRCVELLPDAPGETPPSVRPDMQWTPDRDWHEAPLHRYVEYPHQGGRDVEQPPSER